MTRVISIINRFRIALACALVVGAGGLAGAQGGPPPAAGTTVYDLLQLQSDAIRILPKLPRVGAWGLAPGAPKSGEGNFGILIAKPGQAVIYPTIMLLSPSAGTIEFSVKLPALATASMTVSPSRNSYSPGLLTCPRTRTVRLCNDIRLTITRGFLRISASTKPLAILSANCC